jgi:hypothetical protein
MFVTAKPTIYVHKAETAIQLSPNFRLAQLFFFFGKYYWYSSFSVNLDLRWSLLQKQVVWPNYISSYLFTLFGTVGVDRGLKFYSLIRFVYVQDQATYSLYLFYTILLNFVPQLFPFSNKITEIYFWSIDCCLKSIQVPKSVNKYEDM